MTIKSLCEKIFTRDNGQLLLRLGLAYVFLWFGTHQLMDPTRWVFFIPDIVTNLNVMAPQTIILLNGWVEVVLGILLAVGFQTRVVAFILGVHLIIIAMEAGEAIGARDTGLALATIAISFFEVDKYTVDARLNK